jgi:integrase
VLAGYRKAVEEFSALHGQRKLAALSRSDVKSYVAAKLAEAAPGTVRNRLVPVRELLAHAVEDGLIPANPAAGIRIPQARARKIVPPSRADVEKLFEHARPDARPVFIVAAVCGLRRGELFALRWADVDFESGMLHVHASNYGGAITATKRRRASASFRSSPRPARLSRRRSSAHASHGRKTSSLPPRLARRSTLATSCVVSSS